ncbi:type IV secretion protein Rhs [Xenorhabdus bovienii]|uniref:RHS repeat-associated core domain-containing protein n=1 Tax=Xenorhabdus bovienii TaxID=40576 RepID=UPI0023B28CD4|nr:RHS repeat-associated core domain-containing protein [Xenorhabdus bovienii]MDE9437872.1 type IV secretion protein Rhs [Xenorhabdus bovienii]MDE9499693.1 type IV secretion protein Rhs [Xenorhabdus bovienii]
MNEYFSTQASNFFNALQTQVDPRTGQFTVNLPLASLVGNNQLGPELALSLSYSPLSSANYGFGTGFSLGLTQLNILTNLLELSNGEKYKVIPGSDIVRNQKLDNFRFVFTNGSNDAEGYTVFWKDGKTEQLKKTEDGSTFVTKTILSPLGRQLNLSWDWSGQVSRLSEVRDEFTLLCQIRYGAFPQVTVWPGSLDEYQLRFELLNDTQLDVISLPMPESETLYWNFVYDMVGTAGMLLSGVSYPTGMKESVNYNQDNGLRFPVNSGLANLPSVLSHTRNPGGGQPETITYYDYTIQNFLGYNSNFGDWSADSDYIYTTLTDYVYGSTETVTSGEVKVTTERTYNNYHLQIAEEVQRKNCVYRTEMTYYAVPWDFIDAQPPQFQLPKKKTETWRYTDGSSSRTQVTETEFDESGNPVWQKAPDGTLTMTTWYDATGEDGCPAEPNGFIRFMKMQTITPSETDYTAPTQSTHYTYSRLGNTEYVVQESQTDYSDGVLLHRQSTEYYQDRDKEFGRIVTFSDTLFDTTDGIQSYTSMQSFVSVVNDGELRQTATFTGHDGLQSSFTRLQSAYNGVLRRETDPQGLETQYTYDVLGRVLTRTFCPGTKYKNSTTWEYIIEVGTVLTTETDAVGNATRTYFDCTGRPVRQEQWDADTSQAWYEVQSVTYNEFGENVTGNGSDWVIQLGKPAERQTIDMLHVYDNWGYTSSTTFTDGTTDLHISHPIQLTTTLSQQGSLGKVTLNSGNILTQYNISGLPLSEIRTDTCENEEGRRQYAYDGRGRLRREEDELGNVTEYTYDAWDRVMTQALPDGSTVSRTYATHLTGKNITTLRVTGNGADGTPATWLMGTQAFDSLGRLTQSTSGGRTTTYTYTGVSPVPTMVTTPAGDVLHYTNIPELGNVISSLTAEGVSQTFEFDPLTGLPIASQEAGSVALTQAWNPSGTLQTETRNGGEGGMRSASHLWSLLGQPVEYTDITGQTLQYIRDEHGRVTRIEDDALTVTLGYDALGRQVSQQVTNTASRISLDTDLGYDDFGREVSRIITDSTGAVVSITQRWQANGQLAERVTLQDSQLVRTETYDYDERNRLVGYTANGTGLSLDGYGHPMAAQTCRYDALNNLITVVTTLDDGSSDIAIFRYENADDPTQLTSVTHTHADYPPSLTLQYDANGRMTRDEAGRTLTYDVTGRLTGVNGEGITGGGYGYDALNRLVAQNVSLGDVRELYYRGDELVNEVLASQSRDTRLIKLGHHCLGMSDRGTLTLTASDQQDSLLWSHRTGEDDGSLHSWSPYGNGEAPALLPGFNGERQDPVSGTYHLGNGYRAYNPVLMRFNCPDSLSPFGAGGVNSYAYCAGDPINRTDPSGHISWQAGLGIGLGILGIAAAAFTGGASIAAAGGMMAAISSTSTTALVVGAVTVASDVTAIVSGALEDAAPEASSMLGWVSLGAGLVGAAGGGGQGIKAATRSRGSYNVTKAESFSGRIARIRSNGLSGDGKAIHGLTVYRADMREPSIIKNNGGFKPRSNKSNEEILSLYKDRLAKQPDALAREHIASPNRDFVSTAMDVECGGYVKDNGYIYEIFIPDFKINNFGPGTFGPGARTLKKGKLFPEFMMNGDTLDKSTMLAIRQPAQSMSREVTFLGAISTEYIKRWKTGGRGAWQAFQ